MRLALKLAYDGRKFHGFARQPGLDTVEGTILATLKHQGYITALSQAKLRVASRTDKGVSALGNVMVVEIDEAVLKEISGITDGQYFRATNNQALKDIYEKIDQLEKTKIEITSYSNAKELYYSWLGWGLLFLVLELGISRTIFRKLP